MGEVFRAPGHFIPATLTECAAPATGSPKSNAVLKLQDSLRYSRVIGLKPMPA